jgi:SOS response regulatory protein OraA/RecX
MFLRLLLFKTAMFKLTTKVQLTSTRNLALKLLKQKNNTTRELSQLMHMC